MAGDLHQEALEARPLQSVPTPLAAAEYQASASRPTSPAPEKNVTGAPILPQIALTTDSGRPQAQPDPAVTERFNRYAGRCSDLANQRELWALPREGSAPGIIAGGEKISIVAGGASYVARPYENVIALEGSTVNALFGSRVQARSGAHVEAACGATVEADQGAAVNDHPGSLVIPVDDPERGTRQSAYPYLPRLDVIRSNRAADPSIAGQLPPSDHFAVLAPSGSRVTALDGLSLVADIGAEAVAGRGSDVRAYERSVVRAGNGSRVEAYLDSRVTAESGATVVAHEGGAVVAEPGASVVAMKGAHVYARDAARIWAESGAHVTAQRDAVVEGPGASQVTREGALRRWWGRDVNTWFDQALASH